MILDNPTILSAMIMVIMVRVIRMVEMAATVESLQFQLSDADLIVESRTQIRGP